MSVDAWQMELHAAGWSIGDMTIYSPAGIIWMVYGSRAEQRIVVKAPNQSEAWREAAVLATRIGQVQS